MCALHVWTCRNSELYRVRILRQPLLSLCDYQWASLICIPPLPFAARRSQAALQRSGRGVCAAGTRVLQVGVGACHVLLLHLQVQHAYVLKGLCQPFFLKTLFILHNSLVQLMMHLGGASRWRSPCNLPDLCCQLRSSRWPSLHSTATRTTVTSSAGTPYACAFCDTLRRLCPHTLAPVAAATPPPGMCNWCSPAQPPSQRRAWAPRPPSPSPPPPPPPPAAAPSCYARTGCPTCHPRPQQVSLIHCTRPARTTAATASILPEYPHEMPMLHNLPVRPSPQRVMSRVRTSPPVQLTT